MSSENKQRVVGIIVLIAFIALLIPFLFTSGIKKKHQLASSEVEIPAATTSANQDVGVLPAPSSEQNSIFAQGSAKDASKKELPVVLPQQSGTELKSEQPGISTESNQVIPTESGLPEQEESSLANAAAVNNQTVDVSQEAAAEVKPAVSGSKVVPVVPKAKKDTIVGKKVVKNKGAKVFWSVQVGSFSDQARVQKMVTNLQTKGHHVYLQKITTSRGPLVRVLVGHEMSKAKAIKIANQLKVKLKINGQVVRNKK